MNKATENLLRGELIGANISVIGTNIKGKILDETKNTFIIETKENERKIIIKGNNKIEFHKKNGTVVVDGKSISARPEDRVKIKVKTDE